MSSVSSRLATVVYAPLCPIVLSNFGNCTVVRWLSACVNIICNKIFMWRIVLLGIDEIFFTLVLSVIYPCTQRVGSSSCHLLSLFRLDGRGKYITLLEYTRACTTKIFIASDILIFCLFQYWCFSFVLKLWIWLSCSRWL